MSLFFPLDIAAWGGRTTRPQPPPPPPQATPLPFTTISHTHERTQGSERLLLFSYYKLEENATSRNNFAKYFSLE
jgi:hypothetical protein